MRAIYPMSASDKIKILSVVKFFDEVYPSYEHLIADDSYTSQKENLEIIEKLSEDLSEPLADDILFDADDLFTRYQGYEDFSINNVDPEEPDYSAVDFIEDAFDKFFISLKEEAEKRG